MLDREGFRPNVGIILLNANNEVWWGKRVREHSWQFPQGGIKYGETPEQAMYRELEEEIGLRQEHVKIVGRTRDWLRYEVPDHFIKREVRGHYRGQKQIWFLLRMVARDNDVNLRLTDHPEFDAWRWHDYWVPLDVVIEFKRDVYQRALQELSRFLTWPSGQGERRHSSRYLRQPHERRGQERGTGGTGGNGGAGGNGGNGSGDGGGGNVQTDNKPGTHSSNKAVVAASKAIADAAGSSKLAMARDKE